MDIYFAYSQYYNKILFRTVGYFQSFWYIYYYCLSEVYQPSIDTDLFNRNIKCSIYADDVKLYSVIDSEDDCIILQSAIDDLVA